MRENSVLVIRDGLFAFIGRESDLPAELTIDEDFDARGATALPGFVDSHTHIPFDGLRESEFIAGCRARRTEQIARPAVGIALHRALHTRRHRGEA